MLRPKKRKPGSKYAPDLTRNALNELGSPIRFAKRLSTSLYDGFINSDNTIHTAEFLTSESVTLDCSTANTYDLSQDKHGNLSEEKFNQPERLLIRNNQRYILEDSSSAVVSPRRETDGISISVDLHSTEGSGAKSHRVNKVCDTTAREKPTDVVYGQDASDDEPSECQIIESKSKYAYGTIEIDSDENEPVRQDDKGIILWESKSSPGCRYTLVKTHCEREVGCAGDKKYSRTSKYFSAAWSDQIDARSRMDKVPRIREVSGSSLPEEISHSNKIMESREEDYRNSDDKIVSFHEDDSRVRSREDMPLSLTQTIGGWEALETKCDLSECTDGESEGLDRIKSNNTTLRTKVSDAIDDRTVVDGEEDILGLPDCLNVRYIRVGEEFWNDTDGGSRMKLRISLNKSSGVCYEVMRKVDDGPDGPWIPITWSRQKITDKDDGDEGIMYIHMDKERVMRFILQGNEHEKKYRMRIIYNRIPHGVVEWDVEFDEGNSKEAGEIDKFFECIGRIGLKSLWLVETRSAAEMIELFKAAREKCVIANGIEDWRVGVSGQLKQDLGKVQVDERGEDDGDDNNCVVKSTKHFKQDNLNAGSKGIATSGSKISRAKVWKKPVIYPWEGRGQVTVNFTDLERLEDEEFLNDNLIEFYLRYLQNKREEDLHDNLDSGDIFFFNTYFYTALTESRVSRGINYAAVEKWTAKTDIFTRSLVIVPINESTHWYLAIMCNLGSLGQGNMSKICGKCPNFPGDKRRKGCCASQAGYCNETAYIIILDSLGAGRTPACIANLKDYIVAEAQSKRRWDIDKCQIRGMNARDIPRQCNWYDCGIYLLFYVEKLLLGGDWKLMVRGLVGDGDDENWRGSWPWEKPDSLLFRRRIRKLLLLLAKEQKAKRIERKRQRRMQQDG